MDANLRRAKPLPDRQDPDNGAFWNGTHQRKLRVKQCGACSHYHWPPRLGCPYCGSGEVDWVSVAPKGEIFSWTVVHRSQTPGFESEVPYAVVLVALTEAKGVRMIGNLLHDPLYRIKAGLPVEAVFTPAADGSVTLVNWQPVDGTTA